MDRSRESTCKLQAWCMGLAFELNSLSFSSVVVRQHADMKRVRGIVACCALRRVYVRRDCCLLCSTWCGALPGTCTVVAVQTGLSKRRLDEALGGFYYCCLLCSTWCVAWNLHCCCCANWTVQTSFRRSTRWFLFCDECSVWRDESQGSCTHTHIHTHIHTQRENASEGWILKGAWN